PSRAQTPLLEWSGRGRAATEQLGSGRIEVGGDYRGAPEALGKPQDFGPSWGEATQRRPGTLDPAGSPVYETTVSARQSGTVRITEVAPWQGTVEWSGRYGSEARVRTGGWSEDVGMYRGEVNRGRAADMPGRSQDVSASWEGWRNGPDCLKPYEAPVVEAAQRGGVV